MFFALLKEMRAENRRVVLEDLLLYMWRNAQRKLPSQLRKKLTNANRLLLELEDRRLLFEQSDEQMQAIADQIKHTPSVTDIETPSRQVIRINVNIRSQCMDIQSMQHVLNRRNQGKGTYKLTLGFVKIRKKLMAMIVKVHARIEKLRTKRNLAIEDDIPILNRDDITDRSSWFWNGAPADDTSHAFIAESWNALLRQREEVHLLTVEYDRWKRNTNQDIQILSEGHRYSPDTQVEGVQCWRLRELAQLQKDIL